MGKYTRITYIDGEMVEQEMDGGIVVSTTVKNINLTVRDMTVLQNLFNDKPIFSYADKMQLLMHLSRDKERYFKYMKQYHPFYVFEHENEKGVLNELLLYGINKLHNRK